MKGQMLTRFPDPYPDELFYSVLGRYRARTMYPNKNTFSHSVFGSVNTIGIIALPQYLHNIVDNLPPGSPYTADTIINDHTLFPYTAPFFTPQRVNELKQKMMAPITNPTTSVLNNFNQDTSLHITMLYFCPICVQEDRMRYGECYWHRTHQVKGIRVCPTHRVFLEPSDVFPRDQNMPGIYIAAEDVLATRHPRPLDLSKPDHRLLLHLAQDIQWLLTNPGWFLGVARIASYYWLYLYAQGFTKNQRFIEREKLLSVLDARYPVDLIQQPFKNERGIYPSHWTDKLLPSWPISDYKTHQNPYYHLVFIHFMGQNVETMIRSACALKPFGDPPWPCLNKLADHYRQEVIHDCTIEWNDHKRGIPTGIFSCACGFTYCRTGIDILPNHRYHWSKILAYGSVWEEGIKDIWNDPESSLKQAAKNLKMTPAALQRAAQRVGCSSEKPETGQTSE